MESKQAAQALRDIADFIEARPELMVPTGIHIGSYRERPEVYYQPHGAEEMRAFARHAHVSLKKDINDSFYKLAFSQPTFDGEAYEYRANVCERIQVGTEIEPEHIIPAQPEKRVPERVVPKYEYRCPKLLHPAQESGEEEVA